MATVTATNLVYEIGDTAGIVWQTLEDRGPTSITELIKVIDAPRDTIMQAVGWLAREDKIILEQEGRKKTVALV